MSLARSIAARMLAKRNPSTSSKGSTPPPVAKNQPPRDPASTSAAVDLAPLTLPPAAPPTPAPPPRAISPGWRGACQAVCAVTGRRCRLPEHRVDELHRHERGPFHLTAAPGQTIPARAELERAALSRSANPIDL